LERPLDRGGDKAGQLQGSPIASEHGKHDSAKGQARDSIGNEWGGKSGVKKRYRDMQGGVRKKSGRSAFV